MRFDKTMRQIVEAARERFAHYGYGKTTMAEVAGDCKMSPGNLYRYFPGKLDIAEAIAEAATERNLHLIREVASRPGLSATEKLKLVLQTLLETTYVEIERSPRLYEIAEVIRRERPDFPLRQANSHRTVIEEVLSEGVSRGEFAVGDARRTAEMIQDATVKFRYPQFWTKRSLPELQDELNGIIDLFFMGLCRLDHRPPALENIVPTNS